MKGRRRSFLQRGLSLQLIVFIILPLTVLLVIIAVGSVALHQQAMRLSLPADAPPESGALELTLVAPLALIAPLLFALAALWFGARRIIKPLQDLESRASAVSRGDFEAIQQPVGGIPEIQELQSELAGMARKVRASQAVLHDYIGAITSAQEEERLRIARELHDDTIQALIALKQRMQLVEKFVANPNALRALGELQTSAESTIDSVRRLTRDLRPIYLEDLGLVTALEMLARETSAPGGLVVDFERHGEERRLSRDVELALYRIAQQALNNVVRHARAPQARLAITFAPDTLEIQISDNGLGFEVPHSTSDFGARGHFGLLGMQERADLIGAHLQVTSQPGRGTRLDVHLPLPA